MLNIFRKKENTINIPLELKKTISVNNIDDLADLDLLFPGYIVVKVADFGYKSLVNYQLNNLTTGEIGTSLSGDQTLTATVGQWQIKINSPLQYPIINLSELTPKYLEESKTIYFYINVQNAGVVFDVQSNITISSNISDLQPRINIINSIYPNNNIDIRLTGDYNSYVEVGLLKVTVPWNIGKYTDVSYSIDTANSFKTIEHTTNGAFLVFSDTVSANTGINYIVDLTYNLDKNTP